MADSIAPPNPSGQGMTLRDYFAARAMAAILSQVNLGGDETEIDFDAIAVDSYCAADAMLEARKR